MREFDSRRGLHEQSTLCFAWENRTAEYKIFSRKFFEPVPRPKFVTTNFESRAILLVITEGV